MFLPPHPSGPVYIATGELRGHVCAVRWERVCVGVVPQGPGYGQVAALLSTCAHAYGYTLRLELSGRITTVGWWRIARCCSTTVKAFHFFPCFCTLTFCLFSSSFVSCSSNRGRCSHY
uniref:Uncharacterized protein n=1 Tax=Trypanosoma congolense (strain IL3000) TaxID=1068625 RepID=G0URC4_TRYCI|nr:hypothetical protein, unlikely [Trypanosoma congolense IL3000]